ncbi:hypothetical protein AWB81_05428 [Caballeronia arationis]|jgi:hypothetical protein|uniref:Lipoprotein n=1 Tax=Caballeronia arationis TaxID=1777142 RepID=A0A7Z7IAN0_9BURK|nr:hypothetical protein [Caballeronia arationis]SAK96839.1 hypothetical protein AWB81_05428 [Caballeronia arationis]SOE82350.1 hypothetical protein SAMN05446927_5672 [Caballeronia arationis]
MKLPAIALGLLALTALAHADEPASQWRFTETTLFDLIQNNYNIVAVTSGTARNGASAEDTFFLQKTNSVFKCFESRDANASAKRASGAVECYELTKPGATASAK